jgi:hypothetical protein
MSDGARKSRETSVTAGTSGDVAAGSAGRGVGMTCWISSSAGQNAEVSGGGTGGWRATSVHAQSPAACASSAR